jgi:hypothetical protein
MGSALLRRANSHAALMVFFGSATPVNAEVRFPFVNHDQVLAVLLDPAMAQEPIFLFRPGGCMWGGRGN